MLAIGVPPQLHDILLDVSHDGSSLPLVTHIDDLHTSYTDCGLEEEKIRGGVLRKWITTAMMLTGIGVVRLSRPRIMWLIVKMSTLPSVRRS